MATIAGVLDQLRTIKSYKDAAASKIDADWRLSDRAKEEARDVLRQDLRDSVAYTARAIFGRLGPQGLEGGDFWKERDALRVQLLEARDRADNLDQGRLANVYRRIPSVVSQAETVSDLEAWYRDGANTYEKRALQDLGPETIADRFRGDPSVGGLVNTLKQDRAASLETEDVQKATRAIADLEAQAYDAHTELWRHVRDLGDANAFSVDPASATLRAVMVDRRLDDASRLDATFTHVVEKAPNAGGVYWSGDVPEA